MFLMLLLAQVAYPPATAPPVCVTAPAPDTYGGTAGAATPCTPRADAARPTQVQPVSTTTTTAGGWSVTWPTPFDVPPTTVFAAARSGSIPFICQPTTITVAGASGQCWALAANSLPGLLTALPGLILSPFATAAGGVPVMVVGRQ